VSEPELLKPLGLPLDAPDWTGQYSGNHIWAILKASRNGDIDSLASLLEGQSGLANANYWYTTPLQLAVREGHLDAVRLLVEASADITHRSLYQSETLLTIAADRGHQPVVDYLRRQLELHHGSRGVKEAIHIAVEDGDAEAVARLLASDPKLVNRGDHLGRRPLHYAVEAGDQPLVSFLIESGAEIDATGFSSDDRLGGDGFRPVALALWHHPYWRQRNDFSMAQRLIALGAEYTITIAAAMGDWQRVGELLDDDESMANFRESGGKRPLSAAAEHGHGGIVERLLAAGADPNLEEGPNCPRGHALWAAAHFGHRQIVRQLLAAGADPNAPVESSGTATESAIDESMRELLYTHGGKVGFSSHFHQNNIDTIAALLDYSPEIFTEAIAEQAFPMCVMFGHRSMIELLLSRSVKVPDEVTFCQTYLWQNLTLTRLLLENGMSPNLPNWQQVRPLHHLAASGNIEGARVFLEFGADVEAVDEEYRSTPLAWAARCGHVDFVRFLIDRGAATETTDTPAWAAPLEWAKRRGHDKIIALLTG
jgi:ankyrin repeat protein